MLSACFVSAARFALENLLLARTRSITRDAIAPNMLYDPVIVAWLESSDSNFFWNDLGNAM